MMTNLAFVIKLKIETRFVILTNLTKSEIQNVVPVQDPVVTDKPKTDRDRKLSAGRSYKLGAEA